MKTRSAVYECQVMHQRLAPKKHAFNYRVFYLWLDLDELPSIASSVRLLGHDHFNLFSVHARDHLGSVEPDLKKGVLKRLQADGIDTSEVASVCMLAFPRVLGYIFNPVTFFFCFSAEDKPLFAITQVTNTFHEQKLYVFNEPNPDGGFQRVTPKLFYVSPFSDLELFFHFRLQVPNETLRILIDDVDADGHPILLSALTGKRRDLSDAALLVCAFKYPLLTLRVMFLIHWHAFLLWLKKLPVHRKSANPDLQTEVLRPHVSIKPRVP